MSSSSDEHGVAALTHPGEVAPLLGGLHDAPVAVDVPAQIPWWRFLFICFFTTSGGAFGYEAVVGSAGPALGLLFTLVVPVLWSIPMAMTAAELCTTFSEREGIFGWIRRGLHPSLGFATAIVYWLSYVTDLCIYPILFRSFFVVINPDVFDNTAAQWSIVSIVVLVVVVLNIVGVEYVSNVSTFIGIASIVPFLVALVWSLVLGRVDPGRDWLAPPPGLFGNATWADASTPQGLNDINEGFGVVIWSFSGYDSLGSIVGTLRNADKTFSRSVLGAISLAMSSYAVSLVSLLGAPATNSTLPDFSQWQPGYFATAASTLAPWFSYFFIAGGALTTFATFQSLMLPVAQQLTELCSPRYLDISFFGDSHVTPRFGTPYRAILLNGVVALALSPVDFETVVVFNNVLDASIWLMFLASFVSLRFRAQGKDVHRPFRATRSNWGAVLLVITPACICVWLIVGTCVLKSWVAAPAAGGIMLGSWLMYYVCGYRRRRRLLWSSPLCETDNEGPLSMN